MVDDKANDPQKQTPPDVPEPVTHPVFESVPVEEEKKTPEPGPPEEAPAEVPEEVAPDVVTPTEEEVADSAPQVPGDVDEPPVIFQENRNTFVFIAIGVVFFLILLFVFFRLFFSGKSGPKESITLTYWGLWEDKEVYAPVIETYKKNNPHVNIEYVKMTPQDYRDKLLARSKNGTGPDIFRFHNTWLPEIKDVVSPLPDSVMSASDFEKTFYKIHQTDLKIGDHYYGLPLEIDGLVMIYNDSLLKKSGIQQAPTTWDELLNDVVKITVQGTNGELITSGVALGTASNVDHFSDIFALMLVQNGGSLKSLTDPEAIGALESYRKFAEPPNAIWDETMPPSTLAFIQEKVAIIFAPSWQILVIKGANPDIDLKVAPIPPVPGSSRLSIANYWIEGVSKYSKNQIEAWKFVKYLTEKDTLTKLYENQSKTRLFGEPYSRVDLGPLLAQNEYIGAVVKQADVLVSVPAIIRTYDNGLNDGVVKYLENAINAAAAGVSPLEALGTAQQGIQSLLSQYGTQ